MKPYAMRKTDLLRTLQIGTVDTGSGTLFGVTEKREVSQQALTLVISTGGSGKAAITQAIQTAKQKLKKDYTQYVKFLVIDSATGELEPLIQQGIDVLNISVPMIVNRLQPQNRENFYKFFIPKDIPYQVIDGNGAGQRRLFGKVKLYDQDGNGSTNDRVLHDKIAGYFEGNGSWAPHRTLPVNILLLTGISGGTGSGTFLNIAAIAKNACPNPLNVEVYSYIMLPDTAECFATSEEQRKSLYGNGFAALKELESYESFSMEPGREENFYSRNTANDVRFSVDQLSGSYFR